MVDFIRLSSLPGASWSALRTLSCLEKGVQKYWWSLIGLHDMESKERLNNRIEAET